MERGISTIKSCGLQKESVSTDFFIFEQGIHPRDSIRAAGAASRKTFHRRTGWNEESVQSSPADCRRSRFQPTFSFLSRGFIPAIRSGPQEQHQERRSTGGPDGTRCKTSGLELPSVNFFTVNFFTVNFTVNCQLLHCQLPCTPHMDKAPEENASCKSRSDVHPPNQSPSHTTPPLRSSPAASLANPAAPHRTPQDRAPGAYFHARRGRRRMDTLLAVNQTGICWYDHLSRSRSPSALCGWQ
jgi:hypothetical protein